MLTQEQASPPRGVAAITAITIQSGLIYLLAVGLGVAPSVQEGARAEYIVLPEIKPTPTISKVEPPNPKGLFQTVKPRIDPPAIKIDGSTAGARIDNTGVGMIETGSVIEPAKPIAQARVLSSFEPKYPSGSILRQEEGTVHVRIQLSPQGTVLLAQVERTSGFSRLDEAALRAVRGWRFAPATQGGVGISTWVVVPVVFELR